MAERAIDLKFDGVLLDSCAFDPKYDPEDKAALRLLNLLPRYGGMIAHSTEKEIHHPNTPSWVKRQAARMMFTMPVSLNAGEQERARTILQILAGNGNPDNVRQDATHIFEASKYGPYFVTTDQRILRRRKDLREVCGVRVHKPSELLASLDPEVAGR